MQESASFAGTGGVGGGGDGGSHSDLESDETQPREVGRRKQVAAVATTVEASST